MIDDGHATEPAGGTAAIGTDSAEQAREWCTALIAAGYRCRLVESAAGWEIRVPAGDEAGARAEIAGYERDNRGWPPPVKPIPEPNPAGGGLAANLLPCGLLVLFHVWLGPYDGQRALLRAAAADASRIVAGEWWRAVTALTLHADWRHLAANVVFLFFAAHGIGRVLGSGLGWSLILASGTGASLAVAWLAGGGHVSFGASTAAFGAVGILSIHQCVKHARRFGGLRSIWSRAYIPVAAGLGLLAILGAGPESDLAGHAMGFALGAVLGFAPALFAPRTPPEWAQRLLELAGLLVLLVSWLAAYSSLS